MDLMGALDSELIRNILVSNVSIDTFFMEISYFIKWITMCDSLLNLKYFVLYKRGKVLTKKLDEYRMLTSTVVTIFHFNRKLN